MKPIYRTTVILDEDLRKKLKKMSAERDMTIVDIFSRAIANEYKNWKLTAENENVHIRTIWNNELALDVIKELDSIITCISAYEFFKEACEEFSIIPVKFSSEDLTPNFIDSMCDKLSKMCKPKEVEQFGKRLLVFKKSHEKIT